MKVSVRDLHLTKVSDRDLRQMKVSDRDRNVNNVKIIGCVLMNF